MNIETWASIRHLFFVEKLPKKAIARKLHLDIKTVRGAIKRDTFSYGRQKTRGSKLNGFKDTIEALLKSYPSLSAVRIHEEIQKMGYEGGISILRDYLKAIRPTPKAFLYIQTAPAEEAQVDWAYAGGVGEDKSSQKMYCFLMVLSFSGMLYIEFFPSQSLENFMTAHVHAFRFFGGCPKRIRYDNLRSVVLNRIGSAIQFNPRFLDLAAHYLFTPSPCNVKSPHEKGRVENAVHYVKRNFLSARSFTSISQWNREAFLWRDEKANCRIHGTTKRRPVELFREKERPLLTPLPAIDYDTRIIRTVKSTTQALVRFDSSRYSVPFAYASRTLTLKADEQLISVYDKEKLITRHQRARKHNQIVEDPSHRKGLLHSKPHATFFKHRDALMALGDTAKHYFEAMTSTEINTPYHVKRIMALLDLYGKSEVLSAMEHAMKHGAFGHEYLANIILSNRRRRSSPHPLGSPSSKINPELIRSTWVEERDPMIYDHLFNGDTTDDEDGKT
jgi:transposase